ncbi:MAG: tryptophan synthase subunit alpha [Chloroflexota bacterium]|nr:tryptophan synthase subunit alpha [Chloroflexota bacterium]
MTRVGHVFATPGRKALIPYVTVGYPSIDATLEVVPLLAAAGCDIVELGIPFSDPLADGATIQKAGFHALHNGVTPDVCLDVARRLRASVDIPLLFMTYLNPIFAHGLERFCHACCECGVDGLIVPDMPPEEGEALEGLTRDQDLDLVYLLAPTSADERVQMVAERSRGFVYLVSLTGVTGTRQALPPGLESFVQRVRTATPKPLCVGFGISNPEQARRVAQMADGVIVGSRIIQLMEHDDGFTSLTGFVSQLRDTLNEVSGAEAGQGPS